MLALTLPWSVLSGTQTLRCVIARNDGSMLGLDLQGNLISRTARTSDWSPVGNPGQYLWIAPLREGGVLGVGLDNNLYTISLLTAPPSLVPGSGQVKTAAQLSNGTIVGVGMDGVMYTRASLHSEWLPCPGGGNLVSISVLADDSIVATATDYQVYAWSFMSSRWSLVPNSGSMIAVCQVGEDADHGANYAGLYGVGTDNLLYKASVPLLGPRPATGPGYGYTPVKFNSSFYKLKVATVYYTFDAAEDAKARTFLAKYLIVGPTLLATIQQLPKTWVDNHKWSDWASADECKKAYETYVLSILLVTYASCLATNIAKPTAYTANAPILLPGVGQFQKALPAVADAYFSGIDTDLDNATLRLFVGSTYYKGPGIYRILCSNHRIVTVAVEAQ